MRRRAIAALFAPEFPGGVGAGALRRRRVRRRPASATPRSLAFYRRRACPPERTLRHRRRRRRRDCARRSRKAPTAPIPGAAERRGQARPDPSRPRRTGVALGARLAAAFEHAHLLVFHPARRQPGGACRRCSTPAGRPPTSSRCRSSSPFCRSRSGSSPGCAPWRSRPAPHDNERGSNDARRRSSPPPHDDRPPSSPGTQLDWLPWLEPLRTSDLTERHRAGLVDAARAKSPYFRLLARDPEILEARTRTDKDIFYNPDAGLPRAERELAAAATSRFNGCIYCASVHSRFAATYSKRGEDVQRLLDEGVGADLDERWNAIVAAVGGADRDADRRSDRQHVERLRAAGLDDLRDRRRDPRRGVLQLGQPADAVARRTDGGGEKPMKGAATRDRAATSSTGGARSCLYR